MLLFKNSNVIVKEIHNEFDTAQERLLNEARAIINNSSKTLSDKAERLEKVGFVNSESVVKHRKNKQIQVQNKEQAELIEYYKQVYPFQKFLTESELDRICKKYNLIFATVANYKKEVPEKNLTEMENCKALSISDFPKDRVWTEVNYTGILNLGYLMAKKMCLPFVIENVSFENWIQTDNYLKGKYPQVNNRKYIANSAKCFTESKQGLFIAAPKSHFNLKGTSKNGFGFLNVTIREVKDPIVFRYCKGGIQVISKWGLEGEDETLVNEKFN